MATKQTRQAGWWTALGGAATLAVGIAMDEPTAIIAGSAALAGGFSAGVGFDVEESVAVGAVGGGLAAAGVGGAALLSEPSNDAAKAGSAGTTPGKKSNVVPLALGVGALALAL